MRRSRKTYKRPRKPFDKQRIEAEKELMKKYGLRRKREIWKAEAILRKYRRLARRLAAERNEAMERQLIEKLKRMGIMENGNSLDDVLSLTVEDILKRRLQTVVYQKGLARTPKHARQLIVHGHVFIEGRRVTFPSYLVPKEEEDKIEVKV
ncbi:MAG TPA: 30S ribosomal protein S4 [Candidatus Aenigmarchaeota archaeon]|nr:30S ribosomal protein S4 [Candidatus Aenigmarchaeota archaeon]